MGDDKGRDRPPCWIVRDAAKSRAAGTRQRGQAERLLRTFLEHLGGFTVLDPACGSGNFLYLALHALKNLEHRVQLEAEAMGLQRGFPQVGPANVKGIEINAYAAELGARVGVDWRNPVDAPATDSASRATRSSSRSTPSNAATRS